MLPPLQLHSSSVGSCQADSPTGLFTGLIDDVRIYDFALNASHVQSVYTNTLNALDIPTSWQPYSSFTLNSGQSATVAVTSHDRRRRGRDLMDTSGTPVALGVGWGHER